jgi:hypothetical protein
LPCLILNTWCNPTCGKNSLKIKESQWTGFHEAVWFTERMYLLYSIQYYILLLNSIICTSIYQSKIPYYHSI